MSCVLCRCLLTGLVFGAAAWAAPVGAQALTQNDAAQVAAPASDAPASASRFVELCTTKLRLEPTQATALHTYLDQELTYLGVLTANGIASETPNLVPTEAQQLDRVMTRLLSAGQLQAYRQLQLTPAAQTYLRGMALLPPDAAASTAKAKQHPHRKGAMLAQRLDADE